MVVIVTEHGNKHASRRRAALPLALAAMFLGAANAHALQVVKPQAPPAPARPGGTTAPAPTGAPKPPTAPAPIARPPTTPPPMLARPPAPLVTIPEVNAVADAPTPEALWEKFIEVSGGRDAFPTTGSRRITSKVSMSGSGGIEGRMETRLRSPPERMFVIANLSGNSEAKYGFDGTHGWTDAPTVGQQRLVDEQETWTFRRDAAIDGLVGHLDRAQRARTLGEATFRGHDTWVVELEGSFGGNATYYFDKSDGFLRGLHTTTVNSKGTNRLEIEVVEYATFGKAKLPSKSIYRSLMQEMVVTVVDVSTDEIPESELEPTPAIKALIERKSRESAGGGKPGAEGGAGGAGARPNDRAEPAAEPRPAP